MIENIVSFVLEETFSPKPIMKEQLLIQIMSISIPYICIRFQHIKNKK